MKKTSTRNHSERNFPDLIQAYLEYTSKHEATERVHKWSFISILAAALERRVFLPRGYYTLFPNLYVFIIGKSGLIKKSTSTAIAVNLLRELEDIRLMSDRCSQASLIHQMHIAGKTFEHKNETIRQSPLFAYAPELSVFLDEVFGSITSLLTNFYDCTPNDSSKPWTHNTKGGGEVKVFGPCLNMLGASTHAWLKRCIPATEMEGGFTSRIVFVVENSLPKRLIAWPEISDRDELLRLDLISDLKQIYQLTGPFYVTDSGKELFTKWYTHHMKHVVPLNNDPRMSGYMARKGDSILKLSMIHAVARDNRLVIEATDVLWATEEFELLEGDWRGAFEGLSVQLRTDDLPFDMKLYVRKRGKVPKREFMEAFCAQFPLTEVKEKLQMLLDMDEITLVPESQNGRIEAYFTYSGSDI